MAIEQYNRLYLVVELSSKMNSGRVLVHLTRVNLDKGNLGGGLKDPIQTFIMSKLGSFWELHYCGIGAIALLRYRCKCILYTCMGNEKLKRAISIANY